MSNSDATNADIVEVYESIYGPHYELSEQSLGYSYRTIESDLRWMGRSTPWLSTATVFNVGTGREAYVFQQLGADRILHADLSAHAISSLRQRADRDGWQRRLSSFCGDVCARVPFESSSADLCYLNGVLHHFDRPADAIGNLATMLVDEGLFFFRIYRSGSFLFFLVSCLRELVTPGERDYFLRNESQLMSGHRFMFTDMIDDLFVPVIHLFDCDAMEPVFRSFGYELVMRDAWVAYDHGPDCDPFYRGLFRKTGPREGGASPELVLVDQLRDIQYLHEEPRTTVSLFQTHRSRLRALPLPTRAQLVTDAYALSELARSQSARHDALQALIARVAGDSRS